MKLLATTFRKDQFDFTQVKRQGNIALFRKSKPYNPAKRTGGYVGFEVVSIQITPARTFPNGDIVPEHESMPGNEMWGRFGWTCPTIEAAKSKFQALTP